MELTKDKTRESFRPEQTGSVRLFHSLSPCLDETLFLGRSGKPQIARPLASCKTL